MNVSPPPASTVDGAAVSVRVVADPAAIAAAWRALEAEGVTTPFQLFDWVATWIAAGAGGDREIVIVVGGRDGRTDFVWPFEIERKAGVRVAQWLGGRHASYNFGLWRREALPSAPEIRVALARIAGDAGIDLFVLHNMPAVWEGLANPFAGALAHGPALDDGHYFRLEASFEALVAGRNAGHKRKKLKTKERLLAAAGDYRIAQTTTAEEAEAALAAFFVQKADGLARRGIPDPFADPAVRAFYRALATGPVGGGPPLLELTRLEAGGAIRAVLGSIVRGETSFQLFVSTARDELSRASPGETLFYRHIEVACRRGLAFYDMGMGGERYKSSWCDQVMPLVSVVHPVSPLGHVAGAVLALGGRVKAHLRRNEVLWARIRALRARLAGRSATDGNANGEA